MSGKATRDKGRKGQREAKALLSDRDWTFAELNAGESAEDILAIDPGGVAWAVEVKNTASIIPAHLMQAKAQAKARRARWMLMNKIAGSHHWLIRRQGIDPVIWAEKQA